MVVRVGYDLFHEVRFLLTEGQPEENAASPTLDLHIALLRDLITGSGIPLIEIPPVPEGFRFIACMTHDVDHASLRRHKFDHTMAGFIYRSTVGSAREVARGRMSPGKLWTNCVAAAKLPFVYMGLARDPWLGFDRYTEIENGRPSTFFFIPFERRPGRAARGTDAEAPDSRGSRYDVSHVAARIPKLRKAGCEIGLHGIDGWAESSKGRVESERIAECSGASEMGVRMHWLYWNENSPAELEAAGFSYDSTCGFNGAVGYRAGTSQVFKPLVANRILELPLHVMDTALFYPNHLNLSQSEAWKLMSPLMAHAESHGGTFTVNWHDRSIAPERLWGDFYVEILNRLEASGPWFSTAMQAVSWFRKRRAAVFENSESHPLKGWTPKFAAQNSSATKDSKSSGELYRHGVQGCIEVTT
jgi:peptidoglycan/xylan/chitin deacetylase (PgdA/CDA1 family)